MYDDVPSSLLALLTFHVSLLCFNRYFLSILFYSIIDDDDDAAAAFILIKEGRLMLHLSRSKDRSESYAWVSNGTDDRTRDQAFYCIIFQTH